MFDWVLRMPVILIFDFLICWKVSFIKTEAVAWSSSIKNMFSKTSQNSQENICARVSFLIKLQAWCLVWLWFDLALTQAWLWYWCFPVNFEKFLGTPCFIEHLLWLLSKKILCSTDCRGTLKTMSDIFNWAAKTLNSFQPLTIFTKVLLLKCLIWFRMRLWIDLLYHCFPLCSCSYIFVIFFNKSSDNNQMTVKPSQGFVGPHDFFSSYKSFFEHPSP